MSEPKAIAETWLASALAAQAIADAGATAAWRHPAPTEAADPYITVQYMGGDDVRPMGQNAKALDVLTYHVTAWDVGLSSATVDAIAAAVRAAIDNKGPVAVAGGTMISCKRTGMVPIDAEVENGTTYQRNGAIYTIMAESA